MERDADDIMWELEFIRDFGAEQYAKIIAAATEHKNGIHDDPKGSPFRWAIVICIGYECFTHPSYREYHGITVDAAAVKRWFIDRNALHGYKGDSDYLSLFAGSYNEWVGQKQEAAE